ncbi:MAG: sigma-70 family RNA polymerase sigma factor [Planctomycetota bacterium]|nr:sigma-70 family RNA polymerase sigma factor [Planctomycetota bacterium]
MPRTPAHPFHTTRWSLVAQAAGAPDDASRAALDELLAAYWYPLYAFARRTGHDSHAAQDLVQGFFAALLEKDYVGDADQERGRFRTFLIAAFRNHASKERAKAGAQKRGGDRRILSLDFEDGERRYAREPAAGDTPEALFERRFAHALLDRALDRVAGDYRRKGAAQAERFQALRPLIVGGPTQPYAEIGERLGVSETAVKVAVHRLRQRYRDALRAEIAETVDDPAAIDDEIRRLLSALARG